VFTGFWLEDPNGRDHWEDLGVGGRKTLRWILGRSGPMGRIVWLAQDRVQLRAFVNTVMNIRVP